MQHDNNIENKLRELEAMAQPDLSQVDTHWQQMAAILQPGILPAKKGWPKWMMRTLSAAAVVVLIVAAMLYVSLNKKNKEEVAVKQKEEIVRNVNSNNPVNPPTVKENTAEAPKVYYKPAINYSLITGFENDGNAKEWTEEDSLLAAIKLNVIPCETCPGKKPDSILTGPDRKILLEKLFEEIKKDGQEFSINNRRDTFLFGEEGTSIFIPAMAFGGLDSVIVSLKEYYHYPDMILNRLVTKSDDEQLISGGMFYIGASRNGQEILLNNNNSLMIFIPGVNAKDSFQVFHGVEQSKYDASKTIKAGSKEVNWQLSNVSIDSPVSKMFIRAIDLRDNTADISYGNKTKAVFIKSRTSVYSKEELKEMLQKKYGNYYDRIKVRQQWERNIFFQKVGDRVDEEWGNYVSNSWGVGDTAELTPLSIKIYKLQPIDTVYKVLYWIHKGTRKINLPVLTDDIKARIGEKFNIQLNKLGWINCDKFNKVKGERNNYIIDLKDSAYSYYTVIVFDRYKSILSGIPVSNTMVAFNNIPASEPFKIISIGVDKSGNAVYAMKEGMFKSSIISDLQFQPTSVPDLRTALSKYDK